MQVSAQIHRAPAFDIVKFAVMLLVVMGHLTGNDIVMRESGVSYLSNFNIAVAMPLFFVISGYFARNKLNNQGETGGGG